MSYLPYKFIILKLNELMKLVVKVKSLSRAVVSGSDIEIN